MPAFISQWDFPLIPHWVQQSKDSFLSVPSFPLSFSSQDTNLPQKFQLSPHLSDFRPPPQRSAPAPPLPWSLREHRGQHWCLPSPLPSRTGTLPYVWHFITLLFTMHFHLTWHPFLHFFTAKGTSPQRSWGAVPESHRTLRDRESTEVQGSWPSLPRFQSLPPCHLLGPLFCQKPGLYIWPWD